MTEHGLPKIDLQLTTTMIKAKPRRICKPWRFVRYKNGSYGLFYVPWYWMLTPWNYRTYISYRWARRRIRMERSV